MLRIRRVFEGGGVKSLGVSLQRTAYFCIFRDSFVLYAGVSLHIGIFTILVTNFGYGGGLNLTF